MVWRRRRHFTRIVRHLRHPLVLEIFLPSHPEAEAGEEDDYQDAGAGGEANDTRSGEFITGAFLNLEELVNGLALILSHIQGAVEGLRLQGLDLCDVRLPLLYLQRERHLLLLQRVDVLLVQDAARRIGLARLLVQLLVVVFLQRRNFVRQLLLLVQHFVQVLRLQLRHIGLVLLGDLRLRLQVLDLLGLLLQLLLLQLQVVQVPLHLREISVVPRSLRLLVQLLVILLLQDLLFQPLFLELRQVRLLCSQSLRLGLLPDLVLLRRLASFELVLPGLVAHACAAGEAGCAFSRAAARSLPWSVAFCVAEAGAAGAES